MNTLQNYTLSVIQKALDKTNHKQSIQKFNRINNGAIELLETVKSPLLFKLSQKEFYRIFGQLNKSYVQTNILKLVEMGYCCPEENNSNITSYSFRPQILKEIKDYLGTEQYETTILKRTVKFTDNLQQPTDEIKSLSLLKTDRIGFFDLKNYIEDKSGRIYFSDQRIPNEHKKILFKGAYDYDIECASITILSQMYTKQTGLTTPVIDDYINNKDYYRTQLAKSLDIDITTVKKIITSVIYGAKDPTENQFKHFHLAQNFSVVKLLGLTKTKKLLSHTWFQKLRQEQKLVINTIYNNVKKDNKEKIITNAIGKTIQLTRWNSGTVINHLYVGVESQIRDYIIDIHKNHNLSILPIHDGFISNAELNLPLIEAKIFEQIGYKVKFSQHQF